MLSSGSIEVGLSLLHAAEGRRGTEGGLDMIEKFRRYSTLGVGRLRETNFVLQL